MATLHNAAPAVETMPETAPAPVERIPENPNDPFGVDRKIIEEIEEIGRRHAEP
jgi:hypothetical protein